MGKSFRMNRKVRFLQVFEIGSHGLVHKCTACMLQGCVFNHHPRCQYSCVAGLCRAVEHWQGEKFYSKQFIVQ